MGNIEVKPTNNSNEQSWWSVEYNNEEFQLNQPNLSEIFASISEPDEIKYATVREKILAKLRDRKYSASSDSEDQCGSGELQKNDGKFIKPCRTRTESEPTSCITSSSKLCVSGQQQEEQQQSQERSQSLDEFREELRIKRLARQDAINDLRTELNTLREQLAKERELNRKLQQNGSSSSSNGNSSSQNTTTSDHLHEKQIIEKKDIAIGTDTELSDSDSSCSSINKSTDNEKQLKTKKSCDICVQTDDIQFLNNSYGNNCNCNCHRHHYHEQRDSIENDERRIIRSPSDTQQINLKAQLAELQLSLQLANADNLSLTTELAVIKKQVASLKEVIACSRQMIDVRDEQVQQLKAKLRQIEESLADRELRIMSENLRQEYDRQLANIRNLRQLYEERARVSAAERENLLRQIQIKKDELAVEILKVKTLEERISNIESELTTSKEKLNQTKEERDDLYIENKSLKEEMAVINKLFSQMLTGFSGTDNLDIDRLTEMLEENRTLLNEIATKESNSEGAHLPKLLFDIVNQANKIEYQELQQQKEEEQEKEENNDEKEENEEQNIEKIMKHNVKVTSAQEIIGNLPKVWRILVEFLNHQKVEQVQFKENGQNEECYKSVQSSTGTKSEISVSKTYLKLKDLILEKKSLMKETNRLKTLNSHLERRLDEQEKRLSVVSLELTKTWHLVGKMQRQHRQLHTHEQILRYQLQQKKRLLNELKEELEYCRKKWAAARAKNAESQLQCDDLRREFARRKIEDANNSAESGYSDGPGSSDEEPSPATKKSFVEIFDTSRKIERRQSVSPERTQFEDLLVRCGSAPPTVTGLTEFSDTFEEATINEQFQYTETNQHVPLLPLAATTSQIKSNAGAGAGAIPKQGVKNVKLSRGKKLEKYRKTEDEAESLEEMFHRISGLPASITVSTEDDIKRADRAERIQRLEEQCKSLIAQVVETSGNREKLEIQICQFQAKIEPAQHPIPLEEYLSKRRSSAKNINIDNPSTSNKTDDSCLTAREEEYTSKRSERLRRLEEESNQLLSNLRNTNDRGKNMKTLLDKIHSRCIGSREGSFDSCQSADETDQDSEKNNLEKEKEKIAVRLTPEEEAYTTRRSERLKRLEEESKLLMTKLSKQYQKGKRMNSRIDALHLRYGSEESDSGPINNDSKESKEEQKEIKTISHTEKDCEVECEGAAALVIDENGEELVERIENEAVLNETVTETQNQESQNIRAKDSTEENSNENLNKIILENTENFSQNVENSENSQQNEEGSGTNSNENLEK